MNKQTIQTIIAVLFIMAVTVAVCIVFGKSMPSGYNAPTSEVIK